MFNNDLDLQITQLTVRAEAYQRLCSLELSNIDELDDAGASDKMKAKAGREALERALNQLTDLRISADAIMDLRDSEQQQAFKEKPLQAEA